MFIERVKRDKNTAEALRGTEKNRGNLCPSAFISVHKSHKLAIQEQS